MEITKQQLTDIIGNAGRAEKYIGYINGWAETFEITTPLRLVHFLAQVMHETNGLLYMRELGQQIYFTKYESGKLAKRLGNTQKGDGAKYRGRGFLQLTGRTNYQEYQDSDYCRGDIMSSPELLEQPNGATKSGMWFWMKSGLNEIADKDDVLAITKKINGGTNGLASRKKWLATCKKVLGL